MNLFLLYVLLGVVFFLYDVARVSKDGTSFHDQMKASLYLSGDDVVNVVLSAVLFILAWLPILMLHSKGPPTRGAT